MKRARLAKVPLSVAPLVPTAEPDISPEHKAAIVAAIAWAWSELRRTDAPTLTRGTEEEVTAKLQDLLNRRDAGARRARWLRDFETVTRGESQRTADGRLKKMPDLTFRPTPYPDVMNASHWGWFVECKIIDGGASVTAYRDEGVRRFSAGEYAAQMPSGAMLAYVRDASRPKPALDKCLPGNVGTIHHHEGATDDRSESAHDRSKIPSPCVDIALLHLWLPITDPP